MNRSGSRTLLTMKRATPGFSADLQAATRNSAGAGQCMAPATAVSAHKLKCSADWQDALWAKWTSPEAWPGVLDLYEAAAYLRISYDAVRDACIQARDGTAKLAHQRIGSSYRIRKLSLDRYGIVEGRHS